LVDVDQAIIESLKILRLRRRTRIKLMPASLTRLIKYTEQIIKKTIKLHNIIILITR